MEISQKVFLMAHKQLPKTFSSLYLATLQTANNLNYLNHRSEPLTPSLPLGLALEQSKPSFKYQLCSLPS